MAVDPNKAIAMVEALSSPHLVVFIFNLLKTFNNDNQRAEVDHSVSAV
jgi:hypothetical protein